MSADATPGVALFPLAHAHYLEVSKIKNPKQQGDRAAIMEELSGFTTLLSKPDVMCSELMLTKLTKLAHSSTWTCLTSGGESHCIK